MNDNIRSHSAVCFLIMASQCLIGDMAFYGCIFLILLFALIFDRKLNLYLRKFKVFYLNNFSFEECVGCVAHTKKKLMGLSAKFFCYLFGTIIIAPWDFIKIFFFDFLTFCC